MDICSFGIAHPSNECCDSMPSGVKIPGECDHLSNMARRCCFSLQGLTAEKARQQTWAVSRVENKYLTWDIIMLEVHSAITLGRTRAKLQGVLCIEEICKLAEAGFTYSVSGPNVTIYWFDGYRVPPTSNANMKPISNVTFLRGELDDIRYHLEKTLGDFGSYHWCKPLENDPKVVEKYLNDHIKTHIFEVVDRKILWSKKTSEGVSVNSATGDVTISNIVVGTTSTFIECKGEKIEPEQLKTQGSTVPCSARSSFEEDIKKFLQNSKPLPEKREYSLEEKEEMLKEFASIFDLSPLVSMFIPNLSSAFEDVDGHRMKIVLDTLKNTPIPWNKAKQELLELVPKEYHTVAKVMLNVKDEEATETKVEKSDTPDLLSQIFSGFRPSSIPKSEETSLPPKTDPAAGVDGLLAMLAQFGKAT